MIAENCSMEIDLALMVGFHFSFSVLDVFIPSMGATARQGAGAGIGLGVIGGLPIVPM